MSQYHDSAFYHTFPASAPAPSIPIPIPAPSVAHQGTSYSPAIPLGTQTPDTVLPQSDGAGPSRLNRYPSTSSIGDTVLPHTPWAGPSASTSQPPSSSASPLPGFPPLPADWPPPSPSPLAHTRSASRPPSLGPLRSRHSSRGFHPYHSPSPASPALGPEQWTAARQSLFESYMIRLTASAGLPFSWIENPVWLSFCDEFLPSAKVPSRTTLSRRLLRDEVKLFRTQAVKRTAGANATLQADGWTGINNHHLVAFMLTGKREVHAVRVIDTSSERKTADKFLKHIEDVLNETSKEWKVKIIAFTSDASGESRAARIRLLSRYPYLIILDCYAHQVCALNSFSLQCTESHGVRKINLIVGDYLECKSLLLDVADDAEELITWLRKRTLVLARLRGVQAQNGRTAAAVIRPVKTRWTSHSLAFKRLLELQPAIAAILAEDQLRGESTFMAGLTKADAKAKARRMMELMNNGTFWHSLTR
ncbi:hypothetical protein FKP32DRAFT_1692719 [Trametes sanguinea]|nr:hypothetical protein FKP32DRAFT_1692719 [Trametes sanguinea]